MEKLKILNVGKSIHFKVCSDARHLSTCVCVSVCAEPSTIQRTKTKKKREPSARELHIRGREARRRRVRQGNEEKKLKDKKKRRTESRWWERQQRSFSIASEMIYLSVSWHRHPSGPNRPPRSHTCSV